MKEVREVTITAAPGHLLQCTMSQHLGHSFLQQTATLVLSFLYADVCAFVLEKTHL